MKSLEYDFEYEILESDLEQQVSTIFSNLYKKYSDPAYCNDLNTNQERKEKKVEN